MTVRYGLGVDVSGPKAEGAEDPEAIVCAALADAPGRVLGVPSRGWARQEPQTNLVMQFEFDSHEGATAFRNHLSTLPLPPFAFGTDPHIAPLDVWSPIGPDGG